MFSNDDALSGAVLLRRFHELLKQIPDSAAFGCRAERAGIQKCIDIVKEYI